VALIGANGAGKPSTLRRSPGGAVASGTDSFRGEDLTRLRREQIIAGIPRPRIATFSRINVEETCAWRVYTP